MKGFVILLFSSLLLGGCGDQDRQWRIRDGGIMDLDHLEGRVLVVNYWAEWCGPCREEIPELNRLMRDHGKAVWVLGVNADGVAGEELLRQLENMGIDFPQLERDVRPRLGIAPSGVLPETLLFDAEGRYHRSLLGPQTVEGLLADIESLSPGGIIND